MLTNYYTLFHLVGELEAGFLGKTIKEIFSQQRKELIISFHETDSVIIIGCEPSCNYIYYRNKYSRARKNSIDFFDSIIGTKINKITLHPFDRQINIQLSSNNLLLIQLFRSKSNVILLDDKGNPVETFLKISSAPIAPSQPKTEMKNNIEWYLKEKINSASATNSVLEFLRSSLPEFGTVLIKEILIRCKLDGNIAVSTLSAEQTRSLLTIISSIKQDLLKSPLPIIYFDGNEPKCFSIIPLEQFANFKRTTYSSISEAVHTYILTTIKFSKYWKTKSLIEKSLEKQLAKIRKTIGKINTDLRASERTKQYEHYGTLLLSNLGLARKGDTSVIVEDWETGGKLEITLDPALTPAENANRYFEKAKRARTAIEEQRARLQKFSEQEKNILELIEQLKNISTNNDLDNFVNQNKKLLAQAGINLKEAKMDNHEKLPFRVFTVDGGYQVLVGKSGENNDLLTTKYTAKNDLWFHVRGASGSHVVLKVSGKKDKVSKKAIQQAAGIAAYYSKMRNAGFVPVTMCEGKYVRKPKGAPPGLVQIDKEETIFAEPSLPETDKEIEN